MKRTFKLFALIAGVMLLCSCGGNDPESVAKKAAGYLQDQKWEELVGLMYVDEDNKPSDEELEQSIEMLEKVGEEELDKKDGIESFKVTDVKIDDEDDPEDARAKVKVRLQYGDGSTSTANFKMRKNEDGDWKITNGI